jgi:hypothetical protein
MTASPKLLWKLCTWEDNGYHDSYFHDGYFDLTLREISGRMVGSTAWGGGCLSATDVPTIDHAPMDVIEACRETIVKSGCQILTAIDVANRTPERAEKGTRLRLMRTCRHAGHAFAAGLEGTVFWVGAYGAFYNRGYNRPNRENRRVGLRFDDGTSGYFSLKYCERAEPDLTTEEITARAEKASWWSSTLKPLVGCRAWFSDEWWSKAVARLQSQAPQEAM